MKVDCTCKMFYNKHKKYIVHKKKMQEDFVIDCCILR